MGLLKGLQGIAFGWFLTAMPIYSALGHADLAETGERATVHNVAKGRSGGPEFQTRSGRTHRCNTSADVGDVVLYDPANPARCWPAAYAGMPTPGGLVLVGIGALFVMLGITVGLRPRSS